MTTPAPRAVQDSPAPPSLARASLLVTEREITSQVRSTAFRVSFLLTILAIVAAIVIINIVGGRPGEPPRVAVLAGADVAAMPSTPVSSGFTPVAAGDEAQAEQLLRDGDVEAIIAPDDASPTGLRVTGLDSPPLEIAQSLTAMPTVTVLEPAEDGGGPMRFVIALVYGMLFMMLALGSGAMIVQNTVVEKQSRIVEILLSAIPARALLAGKILGNSALAVGQAAVYALVAAATLTAVGQRDIISSVGPSMIWFLVFFIPGFVLVAAMFAASASLVSRQEDTGTVMMPTMMLIMLPYFLVVFFQDNPLVMAVVSFIPFTAPVAMPVRLYFGDAAWWEPIVSLGILVLTTALVIALAARIYSGSLLHMGQRMKLGAALRAGRG